MIAQGGIAYTTGMVQFPIAYSSVLCCLVSDYMDVGNGNTGVKSMSNTNFQYVNYGNNGGTYKIHVTYISLGI